jgi:hypothetical protein
MTLRNQALWPPLSAVGGAGWNSHSHPFLFHNPPQKIPHDCDEQPLLRFPNASSCDDVPALSPRANGASDDRKPNVHNIFPTSYLRSIFWREECRYTRINLNRARNLQGSVKKNLCEYIPSTNPEHNPTEDSCDSLRSNATARTLPSPRRRCCHESSPYLLYFARSRRHKSP